MHFKAVTLGLLVAGLLLTSCSRDDSGTNISPQSNPPTQYSEPSGDSTSGDTTTSTMGTGMTGSGAAPDSVGDTGTTSTTGINDTGTATTGMSGTNEVTGQSTGTTADEVVTLESDEIQRVQNELMGQGYLDRVTGTLDDPTRQALMDFQRARNLPVTGEFNQRTLDALGISFESDETETFGE